jgi:hypothetical protein
MNKLNWMVLILLLSFLAGCVEIGWTESRPEPVDVQATIDAAVAETVTSLPPPTPTPTSKPSSTSTVAIVTSHGKYVVARADGTLGQEFELSDCGWFTLHDLDDGKIALVTCYDKYVTAPVTGIMGAEMDWALGQSTELSDCARFIRLNLDDGKVAFETCAGRYVTAMNNEQDRQWKIVAQTFNLDAWEMFMLQQ